MRYHNKHCLEMLILYLQAPLLQAGRLIRYASSICSCLISSGFTVSTQRQAAFSSCTRGAIILWSNVNLCHTYDTKKPKRLKLTKVETGMLKLSASRSYRWPWLVS